MRIPLRDGGQPLCIVFPGEANLERVQEQHDRYRGVSENSVRLDAKQESYVFFEEDLVHSGMTSPEPMQDLDIELDFADHSRLYGCRCGGTRASLLDTHMHGFCPDVLSCAIDDGTWTELRGPNKFGEDKVPFYVVRTDCASYIDGRNLADNSAELMFGDVAVLRGHFDIMPLFRSYVGKLHLILAERKNAAMQELQTIMSSADLWKVKDSESSVPDTVDRLQKQIELCRSEMMNDQYVERRAKLLKRCMHKVGRIVFGLPEKCMMQRDMRPFVTMQNDFVTSHDLGNVCTVRPSLMYGRRGSETLEAKICMRAGDAAGVDFLRLRFDKVQDRHSALQVHLQHTVSEHTKTTFEHWNHTAYREGLAWMQGGVEKHASDGVMKRGVFGVHEWNVKVIPRFLPDMITTPCNMESNGDSVFNVKMLPHIEAWLSCEYDLFFNDPLVGVSPTWTTQEGEGEAVYEPEDGELDRLMLME